MIPKASPYSAELAVAADAVRRAAILGRRIQQSLLDVHVATKGDDSPVTVADFSVQAIVCRALSLSFPGDEIVAEESSEFLSDPKYASVMREVMQRVGELHPRLDERQVRQWIDCGNCETASDRFWTLDPIDGTNGFICGRQYAVCLALIVHGEVVLSVMGCPNLHGAGDSKGVILSAVQGGGAWQRSLDGGEDWAAICVSRPSPPHQWQRCESITASHSCWERSNQMADRVGSARPAIRIDSQAKYALVARGDVEAYLRIPRGRRERGKIWDHAAGVLLVEEAGGRVTDLNGRRLEFGQAPRFKTNWGIIATNDACHAAWLGAAESCVDRADSDV